MAYDLASIVVVLDQTLGIDLCDRGAGRFDFRSRGGSGLGRRRFLGVNRQRRDDECKRASGTGRKH